MVGNPFVVGLVVTRLSNAHKPAALGFAITKLSKSNLKNRFFLIEK